MSRRGAGDGLSSDTSPPHPTYLAPRFYGVDGRRLCPKKKIWVDNADLPCWYLRKIKTFGNRVIVGTDVAAQGAMSRQEAVRKTARKYKRKERYVWGTVKLGRRLYMAALAILEEEAARNKRPRPRASAAIFLLNELRDEPKSMKVIEALARKSGISISTLRRAGRDLELKKKRIGGRHGHWKWEIPVDVKKRFGIEVKDDHFSTP